MSIVQTLEVPGYQVLQFIGSGACSTIWRVKDSQTGKLFALKRVMKRQSSDYRFIEQAENEYEVARQLDHPVLRRMYSLRRTKRWLTLREIHLIMEYCEGQTLQDSRPTGVAEVLRIFVKVGEALAYMNAQGFVHADMKPNNILIAPGGAVKVIDFGQSCPLGTIKERIQGTPDFIAPEQVHRRPLDARTDVFNFGATLYWALAGKAIATAIPKANSLMTIGPAGQPLDQINPDVPSGLTKLVNDCIEPQPSRRPGTMNEVASRLSLVAVKVSRDAVRANGANGDSDETHAVA